MYIYGKNVAKDIKQEIKKAYVSKDFKDKEILKKINAPITYVDKNKLDQMVSANHQGIVLEIKDYEYKSIQELKGNIIVMLDHITDPHNLGAIIRSCEAAGINDIIIPKDRSATINSTVMKTSAGTLDRMNIACVTNLVQTINYYKKNNYWIIGTDMKGTDYREIDYSSKIIIIIGNEGKGMSRLVKESCDYIASIKMLGEVNSLNASVACALIIFEAIK